MDDSSDMKTKMDVMLQSVMKIENGNALVFKTLFARLKVLSVMFDALIPYYCKHK